MRNKEDMSYLETVAKSQKETDEMLASYYEKRQFGEFNTYKTQDKQKNAANNPYVTSLSKCIGA